MKVLTIGDPHFMVSNISDCSTFIKKIKLLITNEKPDLIVVLGDLLHTHETIHVTVQKMATKFLRELSKITLTYLIIGNHDMINNQQFLTNNHSFTPFKYWDSLVVCDTVKILEMSGLKFVFCPYTPPGRFKEALSSVKWRDADCIFAHQEFYGCSFNPVANSEIGDKWPERYPFVVSGHIHNEQWLGKNIYYPGSSMQHSFGESSEKIVAMINFTGKPEIERFDLGMNKKKIVYIDIDDFEKFKPDSNCKTKLVLKGTSEQFKTMRKNKLYHELSKDVKVSFIPNETKIIKPTQKKSVIDILKDLVEDEPENVKESLERLLKD